MAEQPKYLQVADTLRKEIAEGKFRDGQTLMTEEELRFRFNVSRQTVRQAIALLEDDGLVDRRRGSGTYVRHGPRKRQGTVHVGVVTTYITDYIFPSIVQGMESVLNANGAVMNLSATYNDSRTERNIPLLFMNGYNPELSQIPHVVMDDYGGGRIAAQEVLSRGYRNPGGMFKTDDRQGKERLKGFLDEMNSQGIRVPDDRLLLFGTEERMTLLKTTKGQAFVKKLLKGNVDCMTCYNDVFAISLMAILQKEGMKLPEDMGFIGFDNATFAEMVEPKLTTLGHPKEAFGALCAEKLLRMIAGEREKSVSMNWTLIERESLPRVEKL